MKKTDERMALNINSLQTPGMICRRGVVVPIAVVIGKKEMV